MESTPKRQRVESCVVLSSDSEPDVGREALCPLKHYDANPQISVPKMASSEVAGCLAGRFWASGLRVFIVPLGSASASRRFIWTQNIASAGGLVASRSGEEPTHLAVAPEVLHDRFSTWFEKQAFAKPLAEYRTVSVAWLSACIGQATRMDESKFPWSGQQCSLQKACSSDQISPKLSVASHCSTMIAPEPPLTHVQRKIGTSAGKRPYQEESNVFIEVAEHDLPPPKAFGGLMTNGRSRLIKNREKFACQRPSVTERAASSASGDGGRNKGMIAAFSRLQAHYEALGDGWRERSYRQTVNVLLRLPFEIKCLEDLTRWQFRRLGRKTRDKIAEFLKTGSISRAECLDRDDTTQTLTELQDIWGVGLTTARRWLALGCRNVHDVRSRQAELNLSHDQQVGLKHLEEFRQRMPREEAEQIVATVRAAAVSIYGKKLCLEACGSYRRGRHTCGDVDVLFNARDELTERHLGSPREVLARLVAELRKNSFLTQDLKGGHNRTDKSSSRASRLAADSDGDEEQESASCATYFGVCKLPGDSTLHRRIDLKVYPVAEFPFALLSFTGSGPFNRSMRLYARKAGFSLSDHNIRPANHARGVGRGERIWAGRPLDSAAFRCERDIFEFLGLSYREPWEREIDAGWLTETSNGVVSQLACKTSQIATLVESASEDEPSAAEDDCAHEL